MTKRVLVTGASSGIGAELVRLSACERGMSVIAVARRPDRLEALAAACPPGRVTPITADLAVPAERARLYATLESLPQLPDIVINNAGVGYYGAFADQDPQGQARVIEVNLLALMELTRWCLPGMIARGYGQIVQVSSVLGSVAVPYSAAYVASKHAVNGLVKSLAYELRGTGVHVCAVCPGRTQSEFRARARSGASASASALASASEESLGGGESTEKVARGILRILDRRGGARGIVHPTRRAAWFSRAVAWFPGLWDVSLRLAGQRMLARQYLGDADGKTMRSSG